MTVEHVRTAARPLARPTVVATESSPTELDAAPLCLVVPELAEGDGINLLRTLRRRESTRAVLLPRRGGRRELVCLLGGGVRGAVTAEPPGAVRIATRPAAVPSQRRGPELTSRELSVLRLVADGCSNREIGEHLQLSALTVKSHLARIARKIGTGDRAEMVGHVIRTGLLP